MPLTRLRSRGYSIIELMVAILLSLMILAGLATFFSTNLRERNELEHANQQVENGQYALELIGDDLRNAGYFGDFNPQVLPTPSADPDPCATAVTDLKAAMPIAVQGYWNYQGTPSLSCLPSDVKYGSDILVIRRASTCAVGDPNCPPQVSGDAYFQASGCDDASELASGNIDNYYALDTSAASLTLHQKDCSTVAPVYAYEVHIYFVASDDKANDGIPTLKRVDLDLADGGFTAPIPIAEGIEELRVDYGLDPGLTGSPTVFTANPYAYNGCSGASCLTYWRNTAAAQIYVLARNLAPTPGYVPTAAEQKTFQLGLDASGNPQTAGPYTDGYQRHVYEAEFRLNNVSGRNMP